MRCQHCFAPIGEHAVFCPEVWGGEAPHAEERTPTTLFDAEGLAVGPYRLFPLRDDEQLKGRPERDKPPQEGCATTWRVLGPHGVDHVLGDIQWSGGVRDVQILRRLPHGHPKFDVIVGRVRLRLERLPDGDWLFFLQQARLNARERPTPCKATPEQLSAGAGVAVLRMLERDFGMSDWGPAREMSDHRPNLSNTLAARMPDDAHAHLAAFVLTRIAPTARDYDGTTSFAA